MMGAYGGMEHEYHEGPKAGQKLENLARAGIPATRSVVVPKKQTREQRQKRRKTTGSEVP